MRILSVYYTHKKGGFCTRLYRMLNALAEAGHEVHFLSLDKENMHLVSRVQLHTLPFPPLARKGILFWLLFSLYLPWMFFWFALRLKVERIAVFGPYYAVSAGLVRFFTRIPLILFIRSKLTREGSGGGLAERLLRICDFLGLWSASRIICQNESTKAEVEARVGLSPRRELYVIPNDIPVLERREHFPAPSRFRVVTSAVFAPTKNLTLLLEAWSKVETDCGKQKAELFIAGEGAGIEAGKELAARLKLSTVSFLGWVNDMPTLLGETQLYVHPSLHEGMSNSLLEALGAGLPVLAADTPEQLELLDTRELLFKPSPEQLAQKLCAAIGNNKYLSELRQISNVRAEQLRFDWNSAIIAAVLK